jgi:membrane-associated protease RseP (regulator of RpoE activity)
VEFDYTTERVRLFEPAAFQPPPGAIQVPLIFRTNPNVPFVRVNVRMTDGTELMTQVVADTGAASYAAAFVDPAASRLRAAIGVTAAVPHVVKGPLGPLQLSATRPAALEVGSVTLSQPVVALIESHLSPGVDDGLLGCGFFRRFTTTFDYVGRRLFLQPNGRTNAPHLFDASGVSFERSAGGFVVDNVLPDTAAARAGLRNGDRLLDIDGSRADSLTLVALRNLLSQPGETRRLTIERDGEKFAIALSLTKRL